MKKEYLGDLSTTANVGNNILLDIKEHIEKSYKSLYYHLMSQKQQPKNYGIFAVIFVFGGIAGYLLHGGLTKPSTEMSKADHETAEHMTGDAHAGSMHEKIEIDPNLPIPSLEITLEKDSKSGYNLTVIPQNFTFIPAKINTEPIQGEGHAHIYVDGVKIARLYGTDFHIPTDTLKPGTHEVVVTLNAHNHSDWAYEGENIQATGVIAVE